MTRVNPLCRGEDSGLGRLESRSCRDVWPAGGQERWALASDQDDGFARRCWVFCNAICEALWASAAPIADEGGPWALNGWQSVSRTQREGTTSVAVMSHRSFFSSVAINTVSSTRLRSTFRQCPPPTAAASPMP